MIKPPIPSADSKLQVIWAICLLNTSTLSSMFTVTSAHAGQETENGTCELKSNIKTFIPRFVSTFCVLCGFCPNLQPLSGFNYLLCIFFSASWQQPAAEPLLPTHTQKRRECCGGSGKTWRCYDRNEKPTHVPINLLHSTMPHWKKDSIYSQYSGSTVSFMSLKKEWTSPSRVSQHQSILVV